MKKSILFFMLLLTSCATSNKLHNHFSLLSNASINKNNFSVDTANYKILKKYEVADKGNYWNFLRKNTKDKTLVHVDSTIEFVSDMRGIKILDHIKGYEAE